MNARVYIEVCIDGISTGQWRDVKTDKEPSGSTARGLLCRILRGAWDGVERVREDIDDELPESYCG